MRPTHTVADSRSAQLNTPARPAIALPAEAVIPAHLLDGGEIIILALKPSLWFIPIVAERWLLTAALFIVAGVLDLVGGYRSITLQAGAIIGVSALIYATMQWVSRYYVLTNRRVMRLRGVVTIEVFECPLAKIQNTRLSLSLPERITATGSILMSTAGQADGQAAWKIVARPLEVHEQIRAAINKANQRGMNCV